MEGQTVSALIIAKSESIIEIFASQAQSLNALKVKQDELATAGFASA